MLVWIIVRIRPGASILLQVDARTHADRNADHGDQTEQPQGAGDADLEAGEGGLSAVLGMGCQPFSKEDSSARWAPIAYQGLSGGPLSAAAMIEPSKQHQHDDPRQVAARQVTPKIGPSSRRRQRLGLNRSAWDDFIDRPLGIVATPGPR